MLTLSFVFEQLTKVARLYSTRAWLCLDNITFTLSDVCENIGLIAQGEGGGFGRNVERSRRVARACARRKVLAADLCEEVIYDAELMEEAMHLQTSATRMGVERARK